MHSSMIILYRVRACAHLRSERVALGAEERLDARGASRRPTCENGDMSDYYARASRKIDATPQDLFDIIAQPQNHPKVDASQSVKEPLPGSPERLYLGARFAMAMHRGINYRMRNTVTEFVPGRIIAWKTLSGHTWRYTFTPFEGATLVTEEWDCRGVWNRWAMKLLNVAEQNTRAIRRSLERLEEIATR